MANPSPKPNILFVVLDSARVDYLKQYADKIMSLAEEGAFFDNAVAPGRYSLPSHASLFSGEKPSEHRIYYDGESFSKAPLVTELQSEGYTTHGFSANPYASSAHGFDSYFDEFVEPDRYLDQGIHPLEKARESGHSGLLSYLNVLSQALKYEKRIASVRNMALAGGAKFGVLNGDDHSAGVFQSTRDFIRQYDREEPFFTFVNLMNTHSPYKPSLNAQVRSHKYPVPPGKVNELNSTLVKPPAFLDTVYADDKEISQMNIETIRDIYAAEVIDVDRYVHKLFQALQRNPRTQNTLFIVTADHGQALGEHEIDGDRRMGHVETVSDNVLKVPLLLLHPDIEPSTRSKLVELRSLYQVIKSAAIKGEVGFNSLVPSDGIVVSECPASGNSDYLSKPHIPEKVNQLQSEIHTVVGYKEGMKLVMRSSGEEQFWIDDAKTKGEQYPNDLYTAVKTSLERLENTDKDLPKQSDATEEVQSRLEDLGYR